MNVKIIFLILFSNIILFVPGTISGYESESFVTINPEVITEECLEFNNCITPTELTICNGSKVIWINESAGMYRVASGHVTSDDGTWSATGTEGFWSDFLTTNQTFSHVFTQNGIYEYYLYPAIFPNGKIIVETDCNSLNDKLSLKQQIENNVPVLEIECKNEKHVLVERPNGKLACVYYETSEKLNWPIINADTNHIVSIYELPVNGTLYDVEYTVKGGTITNIMQNGENNSLLITIDSNKDGEVTLHIPHGVIDPIPKDSGDNWLIVLVNGEEVESEQDVDDKLNRTVSLKFNHPDPEIELIAAYWI